MQVVVGIDIGGTKCAVSFARQHSDDIIFLDKVRMETDTVASQSAPMGQGGCVHAAEECIRRAGDAAERCGCLCAGGMEHGSGKRLQEYDIPYLRDRYGSGADSE